MGSGDGMQVEAIPIGEWIYRGSPKNTWFRITRRMTFDAVGHKELEICSLLIKEALKSYGEYETRKIENIFDFMHYYGEFSYIHDVNQADDRNVIMAIEARIIE